MSKVEKFTEKLMYGSGTLVAGSATLAMLGLSALGAKATYEMYDDYRDTKAEYHDAQIEYQNELAEDRGQLDGYFSSETKYDLQEAKREYDDAKDDLPFATLPAVGTVAAVGLTGLAATLTIGVATEGFRRSEEDEV